MLIVLERIAAWLTAFAIVFSLYAHTVLQVDSALITPISALAIAGGLGFGSLLWLRKPAVSMPIFPGRQFGAFFLSTAWLSFVLFGLIGFQERSPTLNDWGLYLLTVGTLPLLLMNHARFDLLGAIGWFSVFFALADAAANLGALAGFWQLSDAGARRVGFDYIDRLGGLTGNTHASGIVGLVAICVLSSSLSNLISMQKLQTKAISLIISGVVIAISMYFIDARRYLLEAAVAVFLILVPAWKFVPLWVSSVTIAASGIAFTFGSFDYENAQRANLMAAGFRDAQQHLWLGEGIFYHTPIAGPMFNDLWSAHVTESGVLDLAIDFGWVATCTLLLGVIFTLSGWRSRLTWVASLVTVMAGELAYGNPLDGFLGSILFFGGLISIIFDESTAIRNSITINKFEDAHQLQLGVENLEQEFHPAKFSNSLTDVVSTEH